MGKNLLETVFMAAGHKRYCLVRNEVGREWYQWIGAAFAYISAEIL
jgi:hypothetical protein